MKNVSGVTVANRTLANLQAAYNGESNAHVRYLAFAIRADEDGYLRVGSLFRAAARAEQIHAANHAQVIRKLGATPEAVIETPIIRSTRENLETAIEGEVYERDIMYPEFLKIAEEEKNASAMRTFEFALEAEAEHARLYTEALQNLDAMKQKTVFLVCSVCGFTTEKNDFDRCPVCHNPRERFEKID